MWLITKARLRSMERRVVTSDEYLHDIALDGKLIRESGITFDFFDFFFGYFILFHFVLCCESSKIDGRSGRKIDRSLTYTSQHVIHSM